MTDELRERVDALERAVTDTDCEFTALTADAEAVKRLEAVETRLDDLEDSVAELEAATQALRGYVGNIRSVNRDVEQRADTALSKAEAVEAALSDGESPVDDASEWGTLTAGATDERSSRQDDTSATASGSRCQACGRPEAGADEFDWVGNGTREEHSTTSPTAREQETDGQSRTSDGEIPDTAEETGTLQRVREML